MSATTITRVYIFTVFERIWHWAQAGLIIFLLLSGFEVHGTLHIFGFQPAVAYHTVAAWSLVALWLFAVFWHLTSGEWRQYIPSLHRVDAMIKYYLLGIFIDAPHPFHATKLSKHNPLQRLAYLGILVFVSPLIWISGWFYLFFDKWPVWGWDKYLSLEWVALFHTAGAFMMLSFLIAHLYLITTGHTPSAHLKAMISGFEEEPAELPPHGAGTSSVSPPLKY